MLKDRTMLGAIALLLLGAGAAIALTLLMLPSRVARQSDNIPPDIRAGANQAKEFVIPVGSSVFEIVSTESEVRFIVEEILFSEPKTVIGTANQVSGQIAVDFNNLLLTQLSVIQVNARTLLTDNQFRNSAIHSKILYTESFEFITFSPAKIEGLPEKVNVGESVMFEITGILEVLNVSQVETFMITAVIVSPTRIEGHATTTISRDNYQLLIPFSQAVTGVDDAVQLEINFIAVPVQP